MKLVWAGIAAILVGLGGAILFKVLYSATRWPGLDPAIGGGFVYVGLLVLAAAGVLLLIAGMVARRTRRPGAALLRTALSAVVVGWIGSEIVPLFLMPYNDFTAPVIVVLLVGGVLFAGGGMLVLLPVAARGLWRLLRTPERLGWSPRVTQPVPRRDQGARGESESE